MEPLPPVEVPLPWLQPPCHRIGCLGNRCAVLTDPANGIVKFGSTSVGSTAAYACDKGYILEGSAVRVCQQDGAWSGQEPVCTSTCEVGVA